jgi:hypothetical protein
MAFSMDGYNKTSNRENHFYALTPYQFSVHGGATNPAFRRKFA